MSSRSRQTGLEFTPDDELRRLENAYRYGHVQRHITLLDVILEKMRRRQGVSLWYLGNRGDGSSQSKDNGR
jgi:hypothetical protein